MARDFGVPDPPDVTNRQLPMAFQDIDVELEDLRRGEIETALRAGAWREGFDEWRQYEDLDDDVLAVAYDRELFAAFDFFYDPQSGGVRARPPSLPPDWTAETSSATVSALRTALADLAEIAAETIADSYLDWTNPTGADHVWGEETFGTVEDARRERNDE